MKYACASLIGLPRLANWLATERPHALFHDIRANFLRSGGGFWVAEEAPTGQLVGCIGLKRSPATAHEAKLKALRVNPAFRRQGIARQLVATLEAYAKQTGIHRLVLGIHQTATPAIGLYEQIGKPIPKPCRVATKRFITKKGI